MWYAHLCRKLYESIIGACFPFESSGGGFDMNGGSNTSSRFFFYCRCLSCFGEIHLSSTWNRANL